VGGFDRRIEEVLAAVGKRRDNARANGFPPFRIRRADFPAFRRSPTAELLIENQRALPVFWKRP
jgi:hypothetical protein